jgi:4-amino-4-deoxy-L-arabinose transferase-like glycosyltransferase
MSQLSRILLLIAFASLPLIGIPSIGGSSEAREGQVIAVMAGEREFILPLRNGVIPSKPPLFHWLGYGTSLVVGAVNEFSVRLPSLLAGLALLAVVAFVVRKIETFERGSIRSALPECTVAILSISYGYFHMMHQAMVDTVYALTVWLTIWAGIGVFDPERDQCSRGARRSLFWFCCGMAALARGPLGALLPVVLTATAGMTLRGNFGVVWQLLRPSLGWIVFAAVALPWYLLAIDRGGAPFIERQLLFENLNRVTGGDFVNEQSWYFYGPSILRTTFPWSALVLGMGIWRVRRAGQWSMKLRVPLAIALVGLLCLSVSSGKRHSYLLPIYPCVAWTAAALAAVDQLSERRESATPAGGDHRSMGHPLFPGSPLRCFSGRHKRTASRHRTIAVGDSELDRESCSAPNRCLVAPACLGILSLSSGDVRSARAFLGVLDGDPGASFRLALHRVWGEGALEKLSADRAGSKRETPDGKSALRFKTRAR